MFWCLHGGKSLNRGFLRITRITRIFRAVLAALFTIETSTED